MKLMKKVLLFAILGAVSLFAEENFADTGIAWKGHDTFKITAGKTIMTDPMGIKGKDYVDVVLISHDHSDHYSFLDLKKVSTTGTIIVSTEKVINDIKNKKGLTYSKLVVMKPGENIDIDGLKVSGVPAYNVVKERLDFHPKEAGNLGFVIDTGKEKVYFAGDTDRIEEMKKIEADIALLPVSGTYVMDAAEAKEAAMDIKPKTAIPMHYGSIVGTDEDAKKFEELLAGSGIKIIIKK